MQLVLVSNSKKREKVARRAVRKSVVGRIVLVLLGLELLFLASFAAFELPVGTGKNLSAAGQQLAREVVTALPERVRSPVVDRFPGLISESGPVRYGVYTAQAPVAIFVGYVLGWPLATIAAVIFLLLGLAGPLLNVHPFAGGGGFSYYLEPGFGYLLGMVAATWAVGYLTRDKRTSLSQILGAAAGLVAVHLVGLAYLIGACLFFALVDGFGVMPSWHTWVFEEARNLSWYPLPYDAFLALVAIGMGFPFRWLARVLVAPDVHSKTQNNNKLKELLYD